MAVLNRLQNKTPAPDAGAPGARNLLLVFCGVDIPADDFFAQAATLAQQGSTLTAVISHSFAQHHASDVVQNRLGSAKVHVSPDEPSLARLVSAASAVVAPGLCTNSVAKVAAGIEDSTPTIVLLSALRSGKPVIIGEDIAGILPALLDKFPALPPALQRTYENAYHRVQQMGVQFVPVTQLVASVGARFEVPKNDTPERLARTRPTQKREFVTVEDVANAVARGSKEITHQRSAYVTDEARDYASARGVVLRSD